MHYRDATSPVGCGCGCGMRHTHTSPHLAFPRLALCYPTLVPWLEAWLGFPVRLATLSYSLAPELGGKLYSVVTSWHAAVEDATHMAS
jgi:hypothetical protein